MRKQTGISLIGLIMIGFVLVLGSIMLFQVVPAYIEYFKVKSILTKMAADPALKGVTVREVRAAFSRYADIDSIEGVRAEDLDIFKDQGK